jgi:hypothetical protein
VYNKETNLIESTKQFYLQIKKSYEKISKFISAFIKIYSSREEVSLKLILIYTFYHFFIKATLEIDGYCVGIGSVHLAGSRSHQSNSGELCGSGWLHTC